MDGSPSVRQDDRLCRGLDAILGVEDALVNVERE
jgi:hypothetical protein